MRAWRIGWLFTVLVCAASVVAGEALLYVGTYTGGGSEGIYAYRFDDVHGEFHPLGLAAATANPSFLTTDPEGRFLYAVNEVDSFRDQPTGAVSVFAIEPATGHLELLQQVSSLGAGPAHLSLDAAARYLFVANYNGGSVAVFPVGAQGQLGPHTAFVQNAGTSVHPERQTAPHAHFVQATRDNRFTVTADLGLDQLLVHRFDASTGSLTAAAIVMLQPGSGPRHVAFAPSGRFLYVVNELASTISVFAGPTVSGELHATQTVAALPDTFDDSNTAAEIAVDPAGRFLYVSHRGHDSIAVLRIDAGDGRLEPLQWVPSGGRTPRHFTIDPSGRWLIVAHQDSNDIHLLQIDPESGQLMSTDRAWRVAAPTCVHIVPIRDTDDANERGNRERP